MYPVTVISGAPGSGKTTLARSLAENSMKGVHIPTDYFSDFVRHKLDPSLPGSEIQNEVILNAWCDAAVVYRAAGYEVFVDGVIGPWWFEQLREKFGVFRYVVLSCDLKDSLSRVSARHGQSSATPEIVQRMHTQFLAVETDFRSHVIQTGSLTAAQVVAAYGELDQLTI